MRSSALFSVALAGGALGSPLIKRDLVIDTVYDVVYTTAWVTETAGASPLAEVVNNILPTPSPAPAESTPSPIVNVHQQQKEFFTWAWSTSIEEAATAVLTLGLPEPTSTSEAYIAPTSTSIYVAPTSSSIYVAPSSTPDASTSSAAETTTAAGAKATTYQQRVIVHHNVHRANHSAPDLTWSDSLAATAQKIAQSCVYAHDTATDGGGYGQNIAAGVEPANVSSVITDLFYNGEVNYYNNLYGQANPDMSNFHSWGHFSQIVWKGTTQVGCATVDCSSQGLANTGQYVAPYFTVCNYKSPGNYGGQYAANIGQSLNRATVGWSYGL